MHLMEQEQLAKLTEKQNEYQEHVEQPNEDLQPDYNYFEDQKYNTNADSYYESYDQQAAGFDLSHYQEFVPYTEDSVGNHVVSNNFGYEQPKPEQIINQEVELTPEQVSEMAKQRYLIREINEKGYSQDDFIDFIQANNQDKNEAEVLDLNAYSFDELSALVAEF